MTKPIKPILFISEKDVEVQEKIQREHPEFYRSTLWLFKRKLQGAGWKIPLRLYISERRRLNIEISIDEEHDMLLSSDLYELLSIAHLFKASMTIEAVAKNHLRISFDWDMTCMID